MFFDCEICGETIEVNRRLDWQKHVMSDLSPYICTVEECSNPHRQYWSVNRYLEHEITVHELRERNLSRDRIKNRKLASIKCPFCGLQTAEGKGPDSRGRHLGQHLEEIAFLVAPKVYEDWEFYSDPSSPNPFGN
ncbi:MAG: hypothetical protein LQ342_007439 [Letrouitia transgressa]|nr:MAG: hypothetical protein LQ342_007439 [Letrouitia transgressa]